MSQYAARHGFSLIELLVVLGILVILSSIGVAAFMNSGKVNRLVATEQLIAAQVRQARYTARATGQAVLIYIDKDANTISGVSRIPMWQGSCEAPYVTPPAMATVNDQPPFDTDTDLPREKYLAPNGRSGTGFFRSPLSDPLKSASVTLFDLSDSKYSDGKARNRQLTRSSSGKTEGFALSCAVRPVAIVKNQQKQPLLIIGKGAVDAHPATSLSYAGIMLKAAELPMYPPPGQVPTAAPGVNLDTNPKRLCWDIIGWVVREGETTPYVISSVSDYLWDGSTAETKFLLDGDSGGRWEELALVYTGKSLSLYRNGVEVARKIDATIDRDIRKVVGYSQPHRLYLGSANIDTGTSPSGVQLIDPDTIIDDIALFRIGTDQPTQLAQGVTPDAYYRILVRPDGQMYEEVSGISGDIPLSFSGVFAEKEDHAIITITTGTGLVKFTNIVLSKSAP